jgi:hypothetical protein
MLFFEHPPHPCDCNFSPRTEPEGTDYLALAGDQEDGFQAAWDVLRMIFEDASQKLTRRDILGEWPADFDKPSMSNLRKWLERALQRGLVACEGTGRKADPLRYWLPATEARWKTDPLYDMFEELRLKQNLPFQSLTEKKRLAGEDRKGVGDWEEAG